MRALSPWGQRQHEGLEQGSQGITWLESYHSLPVFFLEEPGFIFL